MHPTGDKMRNSTRFLALGAAAILALAITAEAFAKPGRGSSAGNRGTRTESAVPSTPTAPRTSTPQAAPNTAATAARPAPSAPQPSMASTMMKGFAVGLIGAGLFGLLTGGSLFGGLSGIMGFLGLLLQVALIALAVRLIWGFFRNRQQQQATPAGTPQNMERQAEMQPAAYAGSTAPAQPTERPRVDAVGIGPDDFAAFQQSLTDMMAAYSREDANAIRRIALPEAAGHFIGELEDNQRRGLVNNLGAPTLLQGDLAESWYEDQTAWASVAMRFAMTDTLVERATGKVVAGNATEPSESTEIWTFRRDGMGRPWLLAGVEQA
jgi:predicted lipid-binding transport protein (Tim44 family)